MQAVQIKTHHTFHLTQFIMAKQSMGDPSDMGGLVECKYRMCMKNF